MKPSTWVLVLLLAIAGCGDDHDTDNRPADCTAIFEACHTVDPGSGPIHECHENSEEAWSAAECTANKAMCLQVCAAADGGIVEDPAR